MYQLWKYENPKDSSKYQNESEKYLKYAFDLLAGNEVQALELVGIPLMELGFSEKADIFSSIKQKASAIKKFIKRNANKYLFNRTVKGARLERKAVKRGIDEDRSFILWWAYNPEVTL